jgi:arsenate reductase
MAEGWFRHYAAVQGLALEVHSAGTEKTRVKPEAIMVMAEVGIDLHEHTSTTLWELPDPWQFDVVITVCDSANDTCPSYPAETTRLHVSFVDPSGGSLEQWRRVRDALGKMAEHVVTGLARGDMPDEAELRRVLEASV